MRRNALTGIGKSDIAGITTGYKVAMTEHSEAAFNQEWLIIHVKHHGTQPQSLEHQGGDGSTEYRNEFSVIPGKLQWKPTPNPKPHVNGPQIAIVTGPSDEEIYCDEFGRVKVRFHWDRKQTPEPSDEGHYTCWIRVSEGWAGPGFGTIALPRIGQEVIVSYLEGDPDKPIITGRTYHATNRQPYQLPDNKTITGLRIRTHKGDGYNELYFDDFSFSGNRIKRDIKNFLDNIPIHTIQGKILYVDLFKNSTNQSLFGYILNYFKYGCINGFDIAELSEIHLINSPSVPNKNSKAC